MINLLPDSEKYRIRKEYRMRMIAIILAGILIVSVIGVVLLLPPYFLTLYKSKAAENVMTKIPQTSDDQIDFAEKLGSAKRAATVLKPEPPQVLPTEIITFISRNKSPAIKITSLSYNKKEKDPVSMNIRGVASTRQALVDFTALLKTEPHAATVDLPVSSFAKDTDIPFEINFITK